MSNLAAVTGASSGIGRQFARRLADQGHHVVAVGRRLDRLEELVAEYPGRVRPVVADLSTDAGIDTVSSLLADEPVDLLVNNAGVAHYMPLADLPADKAAELIHVKVMAPSMLTRAVVPGMVQRGSGTILTVAGMIAFSGPAPSSVMPRRALYAGALAYEVALSQTLAAELEGTGVSVHALCPGIVATEFHSRQGLDVSAVPRMDPDDVVTAGLRGIELGETVIAPGVEDTSLIDNVAAAQLAAFGGQSPQLARRYVS